MWKNRHRARSVRASAGSGSAASSTAIASQFRVRDDQGERLFGERLFGERALGDLDQLGRLFNAAGTQGSKRHHRADLDAVLAKDKQAAGAEDVDDRIDVCLHLRPRAAQVGLGAPASRETARPDFGET